MRMEGPLVALVLVGFVVVVALLIANTSRRGSLGTVTVGSSTAQEVVRDNVYRLTTCESAAVAETLQALARSYRILSMAVASVPCEEMWLVVEPR